MWAQKLVKLGWSERAVAQFPLCLAKSTLDSYNRQIRNLARFCADNKCDFPDCDVPTIVDFLCSVADSSSRPHSQIKMALAAIGHLFKCLDLPDVCSDPMVTMMVQALVKSGTSVPRKRSEVLPVAQLMDLFTSWPSNDLLDVKRLRIKAITLLALSTMLRPSDVAPKGQLFNPVSLTSEQMVFSTDNLTFNDDGSLTILFHGIKNDSDRSGFEVNLPPAGDPMLDPVTTLQCYISATASQRADSHDKQSSPVFIGLCRPYKALSSTSIGLILKEVTVRAGLQGFSARSFRPTGATRAIDLGFDAEKIRRLGRWKTSGVFFEHYVHSKPPQDYTDAVLRD